VAGIGNIFLGDDGFGSEVARRLASRPLGAGTRVVDYGIRGVHLAYELLDGCDTLILVDALARGEPPGTLFVLEPDSAGAGSGAPMDPHGMHPQAVLDLVAELGGSVRRVLVVGCEPAQVEEGIGLSEPVAAAVDAAVELVQELVQEQVQELVQEFVQEFVQHAEADAGKPR
jgi:hydrogenase maturation protease